MQPSFAMACSKIADTIPLKEEQLAIACFSEGRIVTLSRNFCTLLSYREGKMSVHFTHPFSYNRFTGRIFVHKEENIACVNYLDNDAVECYKLCGGLEIISTFSGMSRNIIFCDKTPRFFAVQNKKLLIHNYNYVLSTYVATKFPLGDIFACPSEKESSFLCTDVEEKSMYALEQNGEYFTSKKLFDFCCEVNLNSWAYSEKRGLFFTTSKEDQKLYFANIKTLEQHLWSPQEDFKIGALVLNPNDKIVTLLSQQKDRICHVDIKNMRHILTTHHDVSAADKQSEDSAKRMACSRDGLYLFLLLADESIAIKMPFCVLEFPTYVKYPFVRYFNIPKELQHVIVKYLLALNQRD
jgi:hypothetical protein